MDAVRRLNADYGERMKDGNYSDLIFGPKYASVAPPYERCTDVRRQVFDAHHHLWDTRVLKYRLFRRGTGLDRPFLLAELRAGGARLG